MGRYSSTHGSNDKYILVEQPRKVRDRLKDLGADARIILN
jgi:hypothetical protein